MLTYKSKEDRFKALDLKMVLSDFCGQSLICELILALVSLWLLVNSFKETYRLKTEEHTKNGRRTAKNDGKSS